MITVITGASAGIGAAAALDLAQKGHQLVLVGRSADRLGSVAERVAAISGRQPEVVSADFSSFTEVRRAAAEILERHPQVDVLVNNAGVMVPSRQLTPDGHELIIQVNHLSPFLFTNLLLDRVGRVVTTSSMAARTGRIDVSDLSRSRRRWNGWMQYGDSKQANILFTVALAARGVAATCFHPGINRTGFATGTFMMRLFLLPGIAASPEIGAARLTYLATSEAGLRHPGRYFRNSRPARTSRVMSDPVLAESLWKVSAELTELPGS
ncbi:SDR family NAD(P)-dependent oxidoreductase [Acrocarpospora catenulata]|uniref:SDR family NAD(P)-dependent oxidoreductase n=1 Tax=Acrocarpospora catenulata TaxID=2836182 RepID=UPI001BDAB768|nr:SDR family NAD(P)-dependent oxidoreductase [Acrocarpospora catenulata]